MDEKNYKAMRANIISVPCVFEKSIITSRVCCSLAVKSNIAEREIARCESVKQQARCEIWLRLLRRKSQFALQLPTINDESAPLPHAKEMKVQVGGINGLGLMLADLDQGCDRKSGVLHNVNSTLIACAECMGEFENVPFEKIIKSVTSFRSR